jgi:hypothetical protein
MPSQKSHAAATSGNTAITLAPQNAVATYHGQSPNGSFRVSKNGIKANVYGTLSLRYTNEHHFETSSFLLRKLATTPGYENLPSAGISSFIAYCPTSGKSYRIKGKVIKCAPKIKAVSVDAAQLKKAARSQDKPITTKTAIADTPATDLPSPASPIKPPMPQGPSSILLDTCTVAHQPSKLQKKQAAKERQHVAFKTELASVSAQHAAGFDPLVSVHFATKYLCRSRASIYRDLANAVLTSTKVGHSTRLLLSALEDLRTGTTSV